MKLDLPKGNAAIGQSGGPTAVINESLVGCVKALRKFTQVKKILGMRHGVNGLVKDHYSKLGFVLLESDNNMEAWVLELAGYVPKNPPMQCVYGSGLVGC